MKKRLLSMGLALMFLLTGCGRTAPKQENRLNIVATTYPVYLAVNAVVKDVEGIAVERMDTGSTSCLHDYNLTVNDMKKLERADVIALNGAGLEEFMEDALHTSDAAVIDCSVGVELLENESHHHDEDDHSHDGHDHGHFDSHYWMDAGNMKTVVENVSRVLAELDADNAQVYRHNGEAAQQELQELDDLMGKFREGLDVPGLITFHDGFRYFAHAYDLPLLESIEEEAGSEASAKEIVEITELVKAHDIPVIFTEVNGSDATAKAISRETGCAVADLSMCMDGPDGELSNYVKVMLGNLESIVSGFAGEEVAVKG